jgi:molybdopterin/thiamine biosynthesis adenylyltransferase
MLLVFGLAAAIWFGGQALGAPKRALRATLIFLFVLVLFFQATLPIGNPLKEATGGSLFAWFLVALAAAYGELLKLFRRIHNRRIIETAKTQSGFTPTELDRYARHIVLREIGGPGQKKLKAAKVLVIGAGGLGAPVLQYLAAAGVGTLGVIDDDAVDNSNLQRQVIHTDEQIGKPKVFSASEALKAQNPFIEIKPYNRRLDADIAAELFAEYDLILDGSDNAETRYLVNATCVAHGLPLISGAITQWEGQLSLFDPKRGGPCYQCVFPNAAADGLAPSCAEAGVVGALPGVLGSMMAVEAIKHITQAGAPLRGKLMIYDALYAENRVISAPKAPDCPICGAIESNKG